MGSWFKSSKGSKVEGFGFVEKYLGENLEGMNKGVTFAKKRMNDDIFESVSQRGGGEETAENHRIEEIANELRRCCQLYEAQLRNGEINVNHLDIEQRVAEQSFTV